MKVGSRTNDPNSRDIHSGNGIPTDRSNVIITEYTSLENCYISVAGEELYRRWTRMDTPNVE